MSSSSAMVARAFLHRQAVIFLDEPTAGLEERVDFRLTDLSVSDDTLETVFVNLTGEDLRE